VADQRQKRRAASEPRHFGIALGTAVLFTGALITLLGGIGDPAASPFYYDLQYLAYMALLLHVPISRSDTFAEVTSFLSSLVYYR
jgi:hypothetical protein